MKFLRAAFLAVSFLLCVAPAIALADPAPLYSAPKPVATARGVSLEAMSDAIVGFHMQGGLSPSRQDRNVIVYDTDLSFWQSVGVQMLQGNSGWQKPKGRTTFTLAQVGRDVMVSMKFETVATNMFNASNSIEITNVAALNEQHLLLQMLTAVAEGRIVKGDHNALGITAYEKPSRKTRKVGSVIKGVVPGGPADKAGLAKGDVVTHIGGVPLAEQSDLAVTLLGFLQVGTAELDVQGKGKVRLVKAPAPGAASPADPVAPAATGVVVAPAGPSSTPTSSPAPVVALTPTPAASPAAAAVQVAPPAQAIPAPQGDRPAGWWDRQKTGD